MQLFPACSFKVSYRLREVKIFHSLISQSESLYKYILFFYSEKIKSTRNKCTSLTVISSDIQSSLISWNAVAASYS